MPHPTEDSKGGASGNTSPGSPHNYPTLLPFARVPFISFEKYFFFFFFFFLFPFFFFFFFFKSTILFTCQYSNGG